MDATKTQQPTFDEQGIRERLAKYASPDETYIPVIATRQGICEDLTAALAELSRVRAERAEAQQLCNRWMKAAMFATPFGLTDVFDPTNPEAFGESRRSAAYAIVTRAEAAESALADSRREIAKLKGQG
jgi:hypothetical protein